MKLPRELGDLPYADALISYEGDLAPGEHYDGCLFTGTVFTCTRADSGRFVESPGPGPSARYRPRRRLAASWMQFS